MPSIDSGDNGEEIPFVLLAYNASTSAGSINYNLTTDNGISTLNNVNIVIQVISG